MSSSRRPVAGIMGASEASAAAVADAERLGELLAERGWAVLTGGLAFGVMEAASRGAKRVHGSLTIGILPTADSRASGHVDIVIRTDLGQGRNNVNVLSSDVVFACGVESSGTASEVALAIRNRRPLILVRPSGAAAAFFGEVAGAEVQVVQSPEAAVAAAQLLSPVGHR
ncbi:MAG TPA: hypothetical protein VJ717_08700 [Gemmatimonadaceae bacterium]|nr:hypothetical protein [Gemmatimonadaceae bacterium]